LIDAAAFKELLHWRLERGAPILDDQGKKIGARKESQRFFLHAETEEDYASQILAEELCRDKKGRRYWKRVRKANHLLDAECLAAACADSSWLPSLRMLAEWMKQETKPAAPAQSPSVEIARSRWMERSR